MKKMSGFTLAEVLITLALIGVVAAMTLPSLNTNISAQQIGPAFAKAVNTLENANRVLLSDNDARQLSDIGENYIELLAPYIAAAPVAAGEVYTNYDYSADVYTSEAGSGYQTKDGIAFYQDGDIEALDSTTGNYFGRYYTLYIDVNGPAKRPNALGRDLFKVYVDTNGAVIPHGGRLYGFYGLGYAEAGEGQAQDGDWQTTCTGSTVSGNPAGASCAGAIADNNWQVKYR